LPPELHAAIKNAKQIPPTDRRVCPMVFFSPLAKPGLPADEVVTAIPASDAESTVTDLHCPWHLSFVMFFLYFFTAPSGTLGGDAAMAATARR
jgi:hypothetical protein